MAPHPALPGLIWPPVRGLRYVMLWTHSAGVPWQHFPSGRDAVSCACLYFRPTTGAALAFLDWLFQWLAWPDWDQVPWFRLALEGCSFLACFASPSFIPSLALLGPPTSDSTCSGSTLTIRSCVRTGAAVLALDPSHPGVPMPSKSHSRLGPCSGVVQVVAACLDSGQSLLCQRLVVLVPSHPCWCQPGAQSF